MTVLDSRAANRQPPVSRTPLRTKIIRTGYWCCWTTAALLGGCGGGGGGTDSSVPVAQTFTSWSAVRPNSKVTADGMSQTRAATFTVAGNGDVTINTISPFSAVNTSGSSAALTFGAAMQLTGLQITAPAGSVSWDASTAGGATIACGNGTCTASKDSGTSEALIIDPYFVGWEYQSFGVWQTGTATSGTLGAMSFGAPTPVNALPAGVIATYSGLTNGVYIDANRQLFGTSSTMSAIVNFDLRSIAFSTSNTQTSTASTNPIANFGLNFSGNVTYGAGTAQFAIPVTTQNGQLSGTVNGRFYGPAAEEMGGVYNLNGVGAAAGQSMGGGFGAKR